MDTFEKSKRRMDHSLKEMSRRSSAMKKTGVDTNFTTLESIGSGIQTRALTSTKTESRRSSYERRVENKGTCFTKLKSKNSPSKRISFTQTL